MMQELNRTIQSSQLRPREIVRVKGLVNFSRIANQTTPEELARFNATARFKRDRPFTYIVISNAEVLPKDPNNPTLEEQFISEHRYVPTKNQDDSKGYFYRAENKTRNLPEVREVIEGSAEPVTLQGELAQGLEVVLILASYAHMGNLGFGLNQIIITDKRGVQYFGNALSDDALAGLGFTLGAPAPFHPTNDLSQNPAPGMDGFVPADNANTTLQPQYTPPQTGQGGPFYTPPQNNPAMNQGNQGQQNQQPNNPGNMMGYVDPNQPVMAQNQQMSQQQVPQNNMGQMPNQSQNIDPFSAPAAIYGNNPQMNQPDNTNNQAQIMNSQQAPMNQQDSAFNTQAGINLDNWDS